MGPAAAPAGSLSEGVAGSGVFPHAKIESTNAAARKVRTMAREYTTTGPRYFVTKMRVCRAGIETLGPLEAAPVTSSVSAPEGSVVTSFAESLRLIAT